MYNYTAIDLCDIGTDNCDSNAVCTSTPGSFTCACNQGYTGDGLSCIGNYSLWYNQHVNISVSNLDINECATSSDTCDSNAVCTNIAGSFTCACNQGYTGDGFTCAVAGKKGLSSYWSA